MLLKLSKSIQNTSHMFSCCLSQRDKCQATEDTWSPWDEHPRTCMGLWEEFSLLLLSTEGFSRCLSLSFLALPFLISFEARSELLPWVRTKQTEVLPLGCNTWQKMLSAGLRETLSLPSKLNSSCPIHDTVCLPS